MTDQPSEGRASWVVKLVTIGLVLATVVVVLSPNGLIGRPWRAWRAEMARAVSLHEVWAGLSESRDEFVPDRAALPIDAPTLVIFSDYRCKFCRALFERLDSTEEGSDLRILVQPFPLDCTSGWAAANVAVCASKEGMFPLVNAALMRRDDWFDMAKPADIVHLVLGDSAGGVLACVESDYPTGVLAKADSIRRLLGIVVTPTIVGPAKVIPGLPPVGALDSVATIQNTVELLHIGPVVIPIN